MFSIVLIVLSLIFLWFVIRLLLPRAYIYEYVKRDGWKRPVLVAYLKSDGTIIDITLPKGRRRVGQVYLKDGRGIVRLYRLDMNDNEYKEVGYVDPDGNILSADGAQVSTISPDGKRRWYELFLRRHADVPADNPDPFGKCIETGRFRTRKPNTATLLARAGAALVLYRKQAEGISETPRLAPHNIWDTALLASLVFAIVYFIPGVIQLFDHYYTIFPIIGRRLSYIVSVSGLYLLIWMLLHLGKVARLSVSNDAIAYLTMMNRQTGIQRWGSSGITLSILGLLWSYLTDAYIYFPLFLATLTGFIVSRISAMADEWYIEPRHMEYDDRKEDEEDSEEGEIVKNYVWKLDSPLKDLTLSANALYESNEIDKIRQKNPFYQNWKEASKNGRVVAKQLVLDGERARQVRRIARFIMNLSKQKRLTKLDTMQVALDFVQEGNIKYILDEECEEIKYADDYYRFPAESMFDKRGDCDCKSILAAALMRNLGFPVLLLISFVEGHAAIAVGRAPDLDQIPDLFFINYGGQRYYFCETTGENWRIGQESDSAKQMRNDPQSIVDLTSQLP